MNVGVRDWTEAVFWGKGTKRPRRRYGTCPAVQGRLNRYFCHKGKIAARRAAPNQRPMNRVRFGSEKQQNECALTLKKSEQAIWRLLRRGTPERSRTSDLPLRRRLRTLFIRNRHRLKTIDITGFFQVSLLNKSHHILLISVVF